MTNIIRILFLIVYLFSVSVLSYVPKTSPISLKSKWLHKAHLKSFSQCSPSVSLTRTHQSRLDEVELALFKYADLTPYSAGSFTGLLFLATNILYLKTGWDQIQLRGFDMYSIAVEVAGLISTLYHWSQLNYGPNNRLVKAILCVDYLTAGYAILASASVCVQIVQTSGSWQSLPLRFVLEGGLGIMFLFLSWTERFSKKESYMVTHGLWHIFSAQAAATLGAALSAL